VPEGNSGQRNDLTGVLVLGLHERFTEGLLYSWFPGAGDIVQIYIRSLQQSGLQWLPIAANDSTPVVTIAGVGKQAHRDSSFRAEASSRIVLTQSSTLAIRLIEAPELCRWLQRFQFQFYGVDGTLLATRAGAIYDPAEFMLLGDYVASGAYRTTSFAVYKQSRQKRGS